MAMPNNLIFVRHGESELNVMHRHEKRDVEYEKPQGHDELHDWQFRLSPKGVEQAKAAGKWLLQHAIAPEDFDHRYVSTFMRARETAAHVGGVDALWKVDDRLKERDWGIYGATPFEDRAGLFASTERLRGLSSLYTRLDGGESLGDNVLVRIRDWLGTLHRDAEGQSALAVAHGELIWTARYIIERMLPEEWDEVEEDKSQKIRNCSITWYSRVNPTDPEEISKHIKWRKMIYPDNESQSPFGGEWVELPGKRYFSGEMLLESVEKVTPLLEQPN